MEELTAAAAEGSAASFAFVLVLAQIAYDLHVTLTVASLVVGNSSVVVVAQLEYVAEWVDVVVVVVVVAVAVAVGVRRVVAMKQPD